MTTTELERWQHLYPGAIGTGEVRGPEHQIKALVSKMEASGEIIARRRFAKRISPGIIEIPYVRMKERSEIRRRQVVRIAGMTMGALTFLAAVGWAVWSVRYLIGAGVGLLLLGALVFFWPHAKNGCTGLHCSGCRG